MRTETKTTLFLNAEEWRKLYNAERTLDDIRNQFDLDPKMREHTETAYDSIHYVCMSCEIDEEENEEEEKR